MRAPLAMLLALASCSNEQPVSGPHCLDLVDKGIFAGEWTHTWRMVEPAEDRPAPVSEVRWAIGEDYLQTGDAGGDPTSIWAIESHVEAEPVDGPCRWRVLGSPEDYRDGVAMRVDWSRELLAPPGLTEVEPVPFHIRPGEDAATWVPVIEDGEIRIHVMYWEDPREILIEHVFRSR